jgi:hypothetical protein
MPLTVSLPCRVQQNDRRFQPGKRAQHPGRLTKSRAIIVPAITVAGCVGQLKRCTAFGRELGGLRLAWAIPAPDGLRVVSPLWRNLCAFCAHVFK